MLKSQEVIGLSVFHLETGKKVGVVRDVLFDPSQRFSGILLEDGGWLRRRRYVPHDNIESIGKDAVVIRSKHRILPFDEAMQRI